MGLMIGIGELVLAAEEEDPEYLESMRDAFESVNAALADHGLPTHDEPTNFAIPESRSPVDGFPYSSLHFLRRFAAHVLGPRHEVPPPVGEKESPSDDAVLESMYSPRLHLLYHSDCEGFYVPIDFPEVIVDARLPGETLGSSHRLLAELVEIAPYLGIALDEGKLGDEPCRILTQAILDQSDEYATETMVWLTLFDAAESSISLRSAIVFS